MCNVQWLQKCEQWCEKWCETWFEKCETVQKNSDSGKFVREFLKIEFLLGLQTAHSNSDSGKVCDWCQIIFQHADKVMR